MLIGIKCMQIQYKRLEVAGGVACDTVPGHQIVLGVAFRQQTASSPGGTAGVQGLGAINACWSRVGRSWGHQALGRAPLYPTLRRHK